jgi:glycerophosphoryl diester phosphodiesterase
MEWLLLLLGLLCWLWWPRHRYKQQFKALAKYRFAHRGWHDTESPENSLSAFNKALTAGFGMELDIQLTKDQQLIVMHDDNLLRACGVDLAIKDCELSAIKDLTLFKTKHQICTFDQLLELIDGKVPLIVEIKQRTKDCTVTDLVCQRLASYQGLFMVESFNPYSVKWVKKHYPHYLRGQLSTDFSNEKTVNRFIGICIQYLLTNFLTRPDFVCYNVKHRTNLGFKLVHRLLKGGAGLYTVDKLAAYQQLIKEYDFIIFENFDPR